MTRDDAWSDALNPAVVKDLRQALRTRSFWGWFAALLCALVVLSLRIALLARHDGSVDGREALSRYMDVLALVQFVILPYSAFLQLSRERTDPGWALLVLTGLGARRIIYGKLTAHWLRASLFASASAPFLLFCYALQGVSLLELVSILVLGGALGAIALCGALFFACAGAEESLGRGALSVIGAATLLILVVGALLADKLLVALASVLATDVLRWLHGTVTFALLLVSAAWFGAEMCSDMLARATERDATPRKYGRPALAFLTGVGLAIAWGHGA